MHTSGTATNYLDLLDKFIDFVTTGLTSGQNWTVLQDATEDAYDRVVYLRAPGLAGTDEIYINVVAYHSTSNDVYNVGFFGATGFSGSLKLGAQPGALPNGPGAWALMWNTNIPYWFVGNGRCAKIIAKVGTSYEHAYAGFIIPHATPDEYPYPLLIGGSCANLNSRYSQADLVHSAYWNPGTNSQQVQDYTNTQTSGCYLRTPNNFWASAGNLYQGGQAATQGLTLWPYGHFEAIGPVFGSLTDYTLMPIVLHNNLISRAVYGELDGVFFISGYAQASENIISLDGLDYLIVQNTWRSTGPRPGGTVNLAQNQYAAIALTTD